LIGFFLVFSWAFRLMVVYLNREIDRFLIPHAAIALFSVLAGGYLIRLAFQRTAALPRQYGLLLVLALVMLAGWVWRVYVVLSDLSRDPNPRAHLHLAGVLILLSGYLAWIGWKGRRDSGGSTPPAH
jgi:hypothetical protein